MASGLDDAPETQLMVLPYLDETSPENELIAYCDNAPVSNFLGGIENTTKVIKLSDHAVIKFGWLLEEEEAKNQRRAYELVNQSIVRIPRVLRFFSDDRDRGFLVMEYIAGKTIDPLEDAALITRLAHIMEYFSTLRGQHPGSLGLGPCRGVLFPDFDDLLFEDINGMESWLNTRIRRDKCNIRLRDCDLVLCHLDVAPRNILWLPDGSICFLDWASAGYYPRLFEFAAQWFAGGHDYEFSRLLLKAMKPLPQHEMDQEMSLKLYWKNIQKYYFAPTKYTKPPRLFAFEKQTEVTEKGPVPPMPPYPHELMKFFKN